MVRSEAVQRMALAEKGNALFPSVPVTPAFSVRQSSSDAVTRGLESLRISPMGDGVDDGKGSTTSILFGHKCIWFVGGGKASWEMWKWWGLL